MGIGLASRARMLVEPLPVGREPVLFHLQHLSHSTHVALLAGEAGARERHHTGGCQLRADHACAQTGHVDVVVLDRLGGAVGVVGERRPDPRKLARRHRHAGPRAAHEHPAFVLALGHCPPHRQRDVGVVIGGAQVDRLVAGVGQRLHGALAERYPGVIKAASDPHPASSPAARGWRTPASSSRASSAAPSTPALGPERARRISVRAPTPGSTKRAAAFRAGSSSSSPAAETPPPIATTSGSKVLITLAMPTPRRPPSVASAAHACSSPAWAALTQSGPATGLPCARRRPSADSGCCVALLSASSSRARPAARRSSDPGWGKCSA